MCLLFSLATRPGENASRNESKRSNRKILLRYTRWQEQVSGNALCKKSCPTDTSLSNSKEG